jgi:hypothetical protein
MIWDLRSRGAEGISVQALGQKTEARLEIFRCSSNIGSHHGWIKYHIPLLLSTAHLLVPFTITSVEPVL